MTVTLEEFTKNFTPEEHAKVAARTAELIEEGLTLRDLRQAQHLTQECMAKLLGVEQENVSRLERRADLLLSTLMSYVAAMGGKLRLVAEFPNRHPVSIALADITGQDAIKPRRRRYRAKQPAPVADSVTAQPVRGNAGRRDLRSR
jgi:transcriptional regulator with XRE-family HTH domain